MFINKKAIIFDLDGTLVDSIELWESFDRDLLKSIGITPRQTIEEETSVFFSNYKGDNTLYGYTKYLIDSYNINMEHDVLYEMYLEKSSKNIKRNLELVEGVVNFLRKLIEKNFVLAIATLSSLEVVREYFNADKIIKEINLNEVFKNRILGNSSVKNKKPAPDIYLKAVELLNLKKEECIVIEDSLVGISAAKSAGIDVVWIQNNFSIKDEKEIMKLTNYKFSSYNDMINELNK